MSYMHRYKGDVIVRKGEPALSYYLIMSGYVNCCDIAAQKDIVTLYAGMSFGEQSLYHQANRLLDVVVESDTVELLELTREDVQRKQK